MYLYDMKNFRLPGRKQMRLLDHYWRIKGRVFKYEFKKYIRLNERKISRLGLGCQGIRVRGKKAPGPLFFEHRKKNW